jgi:hypothetical protein
MPTGERVRYTLIAVIPRHDWREPLTQRSFVEPTFQEPCTTLANNSEKNCREHISEKMRARRDAGESYQEKGTTFADLAQSKYSSLK